MRTSLLTVFQFCLIFIFCASIAGCGIRPSNLETPKTESRESQYPRTYPNPATDPQP